MERIDVKLVGNGKYEVDLDVLQQAVTKENEFTSFRVHQIWILDDGIQGDWPRILSYIVEQT